MAGCPSSVRRTYADLARRNIVLHNIMPVATSAIMPGALIPTFDSAHKEWRIDLGIVRSLLNRRIMCRT
jgi:hypothetical protein